MSDEFGLGGGGLEESVRNEIEALLSPNRRPEAEAAGGRVMHEGWLTKEGQWRKNWKRRWFALRSTTLTYYDDPDSKKPKGVIPLDSCAVQPSPRKDVKYCLELLAEGRKLFIQADTEAVAREWVLALNKAISCLAYLRKVKMLKARVDVRVLTFLVHSDAVSQLDLSGAPLALEATVALDLPLRYNVQLRTLAISGAGIGDVECQIFGPALAANKSVEAVDFSHNHITSLSSLAGAFLSNRTITSLDLSHNSIDDAGLEPLASAVRGSALISIKLDHNRIGCSGVSSLANSLSARPITALHLSHNFIGDRGAANIAALIQSNHSITALHLGNNQVEDDGAAAIAEAIPRSKVSTLGFEHNAAISAVGAVALAGCLHHLSALDLSGNDIGRDGLLAIGISAASDFSFDELLFEKK